MSASANRNTTATTGPRTDEGVRRSHSNGSATASPSAKAKLGRRPRRSLLRSFEVRNFDPDALGSSPSPKQQSPGPGRRTTTPRVASPNIGAANARTTSPRRRLRSVTKSPKKTAGVSTQPQTQRRASAPQNALSAITLAAAAAAARRRSTLKASESPQKLGFAAQQSRAVPEPATRQRRQSARKIDPSGVPKSASQSTASKIDLVQDLPIVRGGVTRVPSREFHEVGPGGEPAAASSSLGRASSLSPARTAKESPRVVSSPASYGLAEGIAVDRFTIGTSVHEDSRGQSTATYKIDNDDPVRSVGTVAAQLYSVDEGDNPQLPPVELTIYLHALTLPANMTRRAQQNIFLQIRCFHHAIDVAGTLQKTRSDGCGVYGIDMTVKMVVPADAVPHRSSKVLPTRLSQEGLNSQQKAPRSSGQKSSPSGSLTGQQKKKLCDHVKISLYNTPNMGSNFWRSRRRVGQIIIPLEWSSDTWTAGQPTHFDVLIEQKLPKYYVPPRGQDLFLRQGTKYFKRVGYIKATPEIAFLNIVRCRTCICDASSHSRALLVTVELCLPCRRLRNLLLCWLVCRQSQKRSSQKLRLSTALRVGRFPPTPSGSVLPTARAINFTTRRMPYGS